MRLNTVSSKSKSKSKSKSVSVSSKPVSSRSVSSRSVSPRLLLPRSVSLKAIVAAGCAAGVAVLVWWPTVVVLVILAGAVALRPALVARELDRTRAAALPEVIDLVHVAISSGETTTAALRLVADVGPVIVRPGVHAVLDQIDAGTTLHRSLLRLPQLLGPDFQSLAVSLAQAEREGSPVGALLIRLADEAAAARRRQQERSARRLPVQMLMPLVLCSLPAVLLGAVVPLILVSLRGL